MKRRYLWVPVSIGIAVFVGCVVGGRFGSEGPTESVMPVATAGPTALDYGPDDSVPICAHPSGWRAATNGHGIFALVYDDGPVKVTVTVLGADGVTTKTAAVRAGEPSAFVDFPEVYPLSVSAAYATAERPGGQPARCILDRTDR